MNILHLQNHLNISCGISKTIFLIVKNTSSNFNHNVACLDGDGFLRFESLNINPLVLKNYKYPPVCFIIHFVKLYLFCKQNQINIIHSHHRYFDLLAFLLSHFIKVKTITSVQSKVYNHKLFSYKSNYLVACSETIKNHLICYFRIDERKIKVIYNSVDSEEIGITKSKTKLLDELEIADDKFIIGYFGRLNFKEKGVDILLDAFLNLSNVNKDIFLLLVGNGVDEIKIRSFTSQNRLSAKVINSQEDICNYYQLLDVFVLPSRVDPFPLVMLETGLMKKSFIGSNVDGIAELIENEKDGLLFESGDSDDLQNKILKIYYDKKYADNLAENLYKKIIANYTVQKTIPQYQELYKKLIENV